VTALVSVERDLRAAVNADVVAPTSAYLTDMTEARGLHGRADAVALPRSAEEVAEVVAWCYEREVPIIPRGGGTGYAGGAVALDAGVVLALERLDRVRSFDPLLWRMEVEAGVTTANVRRVAREGGLLFAPDPGAAEQSQIGGNIATNAGGPHAYKYGVTGAWVLGLEVVAWCYEREVPIVPRGGGTGYAGGAVALDGGVVLSLERLDRVRSFDPLLWRMEVEAGVTTANVRRIAREGGLLFAPDPGAAEQSQIGGNIATNAGGPHAYKYGVTGAWVLGLEVVVAPGELVRCGGPVR